MSSADLWPHQRGAIDWVATAGSGLLHIPMGGGKTRIAIESTIGAGAERVLVLSPLAVCPVWAAETARWHPGTSVTVLDDGPVARRAAAVPDRGVVVTNYDAAWRGPLARALERVPWDAVILDESHRIKSPSGRASRWVRALCDGRRGHARLLALTGTPMPHGPLDVWAQLRAVRPDAVTRTYTEWRSRYAIIGRLGPWHVVGYRDLDGLAARIAPAVYRVDAITRPPSVTVDIPVHLEPAAMRTYRQMERDAVAVLASGETLTAASRLVQLLRLQQMTGGSVGDAVVSRAKAVAVRDLLEDLPEDEPVVIMGVYHSDLDQAHEVARELGRESLELSGRRNQLAEWQAGAAPVLVVQLRAGSVGVSMVRAAYLIMWSMGYSLGDYDQAVARLVRPGQTRPVTIYRLVASGTVDQHVVAAIQRKADVAEYVTNAIVGSRSGRETAEVA